MALDSGMPLAKSVLVELLREAALVVDTPPPVSTAACSSECWKAFADCDRAAVATVTAVVRHYLTGVPPER